MPNKPIRDEGSERRFFSVGVVLKLTHGMQKVNQQRVAKPHYERGTSLIMRGEFEAALEALNTAIRADDTYTEAFRARGHAHYALNDLEAALADYRTYVRLARSSAEPTVKQKIADIEARLT